MQKHKAENYVKMGFYAAVIVSLVLLIPPTMNYKEFYVAMNNIYVRVDWFTYSEINGGEKVQVNSQFTLVHNSSYVGLRLHSITLRLHYEDREEPLVGNRFWFKDEPLNASSEMQLPLNQVSTSQVSEDFLELKQKGAVRGVVRTYVYVYMFSGYDPVRVYLDDVPLDL